MQVMIMAIGAAVMVMLVAFFVCLLIGLPVMLLWNWLMPLLFKLPIITFWQAVGLSLLCGFLFGNKGAIINKKES